MSSLDRHSKLVYNMLIYDKLVYNKGDDFMCRKKYKNDLMTKERIIKHKMKQAHHMFERVLHQNLNETEVFAGESRLLMRIADHENLSQRELARRVGTSPASVGVSLKKLESKGYIVRREDDNDSRANQIELTDKGDEFIEETHELFQRLDKAIFQGFSEEEMNVLESFLDRMHHNLDQMMGDRV